MVVPPTAVPPARAPLTARMARRLCEAPTVALLPSVHMAEPRIVHPATAVRFMLAPSSDHGSRHPITVPSSPASRLAR